MTLWRMIKFANDLLYFRSKQLDITQSKVKLVFIFSFILYKSIKYNKAPSKLFHLLVHKEMTFQRFLFVVHSKYSIENLANCRHCVDLRFGKVRIWPQTQLQTQAHFPSVKRFHYMRKKPSTIRKLIRLSLLYKHFS